jgi:hypothetical protein
MQYQRVVLFRRKESNQYNVTPFSQPSSSYQPNTVVSFSRDSGSSGPHPVSTHHYVGVSAGISKRPTAPKIGRLADCGNIHLPSGLKECAAGYRSLYRLFMAIDLH